MAATRKKRGSGRPKASRKSARNRASRKARRVGSHKGKKFWKMKKSSTRPGKLDFTTKKSSKVYDRNSHWEHFSADRLRDSPYGRLLVSAGVPKKGKKKKTKGRTKRSSGRRSSGSLVAKYAQCFSF